MTSRTRVNFHCHSDLSDGAYPPETVAMLLADDGVRYAALTDHDTVAGVERFRAVFEARGGTCLTGVEITARLGSNEVHLLAYGFDPVHPDLCGALDLIRRQRHIGLHTMLDSIRSGLKGTRANDPQKEPNVEAPRALPPHDCAEIIRLVHEAGGRAFLAHPLDLSPDLDEIARVVRELRGVGLDGLEAYCPEHSPEVRESLITLARDEELLLVGGTDLHRPDKTDKLHAGIDIPTRVWKDFRDVLDHSVAAAPQAVEDAEALEQPGPRWRRVALHIVLPAVLAIGLFLFASFAVLIPASEEALLERKRETVSELTAAAVSLLEEYERLEQLGLLSRSEAQAQATARIRDMRYGPERKDYFWLSDTRPFMVMHPYRTELDGTSLATFEDAHGKRLFVEFARTAEQEGQGFVEYMWQWKDDPTRIVPKLSHVRLFEPWGWIVGTGIYIDDVGEEIHRLSRRLEWVAFGVTALVAALLIYVVQQSLRIERQRSRAECGLRASHEKYRVLVETATEGTMLILDGKCAYANRAILDMLGYAQEEVPLLDVHDLLPDATPEDNATVRYLTDVMEGKPGPVRYEGQLRRKNGDLLDVTLGCQRIAMGSQEGLVVSAQQAGSGAPPPRNAIAAKQKALLDELQSSLLFLNEPVSHFLHHAVSCPLDTPIDAASRLMTRHDFSAALVLSESGSPLGMVTDGDLRKRVLAGGHDPRRPVHEVMSSPLVVIDDNALVHEALLRMQEAGVRHLAVRDSDGAVIGVVRSKDLLEFHRYASAVVVGEVERAGSVEEVVAARERLPMAIASLIDAGARPQSVVRLLTSVHDAVTNRLLRLAMDELGPPPRRFAFVCMGSEGREEETLVTDQDNGIIYEDPKPAEADQAQAYFLELGERVCAWLDAAGYRYCKGGVMAREPLWCGSLSTWRDRFAQWITASEPEDILRFDMCFDFRCAYGADELAHDLRRFVLQRLSERPESLAHFARNAMLYKPPLGFFGQITTRSSGEDENVFDIKDAMMPIVKFARVYALREQSPQVNTLERLERMARLGDLSESGHHETAAAYEFLLLLRLKHQIQAINAGKRPGNRINPKMLTHIDEATLRESFSQIAIIQKRISYDFLGVPEG